MCVQLLILYLDGTQLIVAAGHRVHVYDTADGDLIQSLKGMHERDVPVCGAHKPVQATRTLSIALLTQRMASDSLLEGKRTLTTLAPLTQLTPTLLQSG